MNTCTGNGLVDYASIVAKIGTVLWWKHREENYCSLGVVIGLQCEFVLSKKPLFYLCPIRSPCLTIYLLAPVFINCLTLCFAKFTPQTINLGVTKAGWLHSIGSSACTGQGGTHRERQQLSGCLGVPVSAFHVFNTCRVTPTNGCCKSFNSWLTFELQPYFSYMRSRVNRRQLFAGRFCHLVFCQMHSKLNTAYKARLLYRPA